MRFIDGLPYYTLDEIQKISPKPNKLLDDSNLVTLRQYYMNSYRYLFLNWIGMYFENSTDITYSLKKAEYALEKSISNNIDYIKEKYCRIT